MHKKGFTLIEILVVLIIVGILAAIAVPNYFNFMENAATQAAINNLMTIANAEKTFYLNNGEYLGGGIGDTGGVGGSPSCGTAAAYTLSEINCNLGLNISDTFFDTYRCDLAGVDLPSPVCYTFSTAQNFGLAIYFTQPEGSNNPWCYGNPCTALGYTPGPSPT